MYPGVGLYPRDLDHVSWSRNGILDIQLMYPGEGLYPGDLVHVSSIRILSQISSLCIQVKDCILGSSSYIQEQDCILEIQFTYPEVGLHPGDLVLMYPKQDCILEVQFMYPGVGLYPGVQYMYTAVGLYPRYLVYVSRSRIVSCRYSLCIQEQDCILVIQFLYPGVGFILDIQFMHPYLGLYPEDLFHVSQRMIPSINQIY